MATIEDLGVVSISSMDASQGMDLIKQIRLSRRTVKARAKKKGAKKAKGSKPPKLSATQAKALLQIIEEGEQT